MQFDQPRGSKWCLGPLENNWPWPALAFSCRFQSPLPGQEGNGDVCILHCSVSNLNKVIKNISVHAGKHTPWRAEWESARCRGFAGKTACYRARFSSGIWEDEDVVGVRGERGEETSKLVNFGGFLHLGANEVVAVSYYVPHTFWRRREHGQQHKNKHINTHTHTHTHTHNTHLHTCICKCLLGKLALRSCRKNVNLNVRHSINIYFIIHTIVVKFSFFTLTRNEFNTLVSVFEIIWINSWQTFFNAMSSSCGEWNMRVNCVKCWKYILFFLFLPFHKPCASLAESPWYQVRPVKMTIHETAAPGFRAFLFISFPTYILQESKQSVISVKRKQIAAGKERFRGGCKM